MKEIWDNIWGEDEIYSSSKYRKMANVKVQRVTFDSTINNSVILEIGCGDGVVLEEFDRLYKNNELIGVDISEFAIQRAIEKNTASISYKVSDARTLPIESEKCDVVYSIGLIEHFNTEDLEKVLSEKKRVLKHGGKLVLMVPNKLSFGRIQRKILKKLGKWSFGYQTEFSPTELISMLENEGFKNLNIKSYNVFKPKGLNSFLFYMVD